MSYICLIESTDETKNISIVVKSFSEALTFTNEHIAMSPQYSIKEALILEEEPSTDVFSYPKLVAQVRTIR